MVQSHILGHVVRRGIEAVAAPQNEFYIQQLKKAAMAYEEAGPEMEVNPVEFLPAIITAISVMVVFASIRYTLGEVVATLAMIEQPETTVIETVTRIVDESSPDAPLEKEKDRLIDEEVIVIKQDAVTASIGKTLQLLHRLGGFRARWRGLGAAMVYHMTHSLSVNFISAFLGPSLPLRGIAYILSSVLLSRIHMTWTHVMISQPSEKPWYRRIPSEKKIWKALALPAFVYASAEIVTMVLPILVAVFLAPSNVHAAQPELAELGPIAIRLAMAGVTMLVVSVLILLPASVTLTRIEASFLPEDQETIVPFDRTLNGAATSAVALDACSNKSLFVEAWRSFNMAARVRLVRFYVKMALIQVLFVLWGVLMIGVQLYIFGIERLAIYLQSASAQLQLMAMGVAQD